MPADTYRCVAIRDDAPAPAAKFERRADAYAWVCWRLEHHPKESWTVFTLSNPSQFRLGKAER